MGVWKAMADGLQKKLSDQGNQKSPVLNDQERIKSILENVTYDNMVGKEKPTGNYIYGLEKKGS